MTTREPSDPGAPPQPELLDRLWDRLDGPARAALTALAEAAASHDLALFAVGGVVRDLLRTPEGGATIADLDLAVEGDPAPLLDDLARGAATRLTRHDRFGTATLRIGPSPAELVRIDLARTRRERYPRPGALPVVAPATIADDLARRDFSVNAMALGIGGAGRGALLDPFGGRRDLDRGLIRALHERCFRDDPTRLIRACRYAARLDARLAPGTGAQVRASAPSLRTIGAARFGEAWRRLLLDAAAPQALARAVALQLPAARVVGWFPPPRLVVAFGEITRATPGDVVTVFWALTGLTAPPAVVRALPGACALTREERRALQGGEALRAQRDALGRAGLRDSAAAARLRERDPIVLRAAASLWRGRAGGRVGRASTEWSDVESPLDAEALAALGVPAGPEIGRWLSILRDAVIDGALAPGRAGVAPARRLVREAAGGSRAGGRGRDQRLHWRRPAGGAGRTPP